jgi:hypothetical protein
VSYTFAPCSSSTQGTIGATCSFMRPYQSRIGPGRFLTQRSCTGIPSMPRKVPNTIKSSILGKSSCRDKNGCRLNTRSRTTNTSSKAFCSSTMPCFSAKTHNQRTYIYPGRRWVRTQKSSTLAPSTPTCQRTLDSGSSYIHGLERRKKQQVRCHFHIVRALTTPTFSLAKSFSRTNEPNV